MAGQLDLIDPQKRLETFEKISSEGLLGVNKETIRGNESVSYTHLRAHETV